MKIIATLNRTGCKDSITVLAPTCNCPTVNPPIGENKVICVGDPIPQLTFTVGTGETADWYSTPTGGTPLTGGTGTVSFTPPANGGTFYVEARKTDGSNCKSTTRIEIKLVVTPKPTLIVSELPKCADNRQTYSFVIESNGTPTVLPAAAQVQALGNNKFSVTNVPVNTDAVVTVKVNNCETQLTVKTPNCDCPPPKCVPVTVKKVKVKPTTAPIVTPTTGGK